ncbi:MAG TPA: alpha/beta fold hydrolase [Candidatus Limnocylindria bacterium]|nr:alpha/beta fold hydrolase [Candidatus Limnocylindria bacterium]
MAPRFSCLLLGLLLAGLTGCTPGSIIAHQLVKSPNRQPAWLTEPGRLLPPAKVTLSYYAKFPDQSVSLQEAVVGEPPAKLQALVIEPGRFGFQASSRWEKSGSHPVFRFEMRLNPPTNSVEPAPPVRGTIFPLHGYALSKDVMMPWGFSLAEEGWRCVLVDLRGHGHSGGDRIYFGTREPEDLRELLTELTRRHVIRGPVGVLGDSYGATTALRWAAQDSRVQAVVALAPYDKLADAMEGIRKSYSPWVPRGWVRSAARRLPALLGVTEEGVNTAHTLAARTVRALFVAGQRDVVAPVAAVQQLKELTQPDSQLLVVPQAAHEELPYEFDMLEKPVKAWFDGHLR